MEFNPRTPQRNGESTKKRRYCDLSFAETTAKETKRLKIDSDLSGKKSSGESSTLSLRERLEGMELSSRVNSTTGTVKAIWVRC